MPRRFLSKAERIRLSQFPAEVSDNDCVVYFTLTPSDLELVGRRRRDENHLGFALLIWGLTRMRTENGHLKRPFSLVDLKIGDHVCA